MTRLTVNHCWILDMSQLLRTGAIVPGVAKTGMGFELDGIPGYSSHLRYVRINSWYPARGDAGMQVFFPNGSTDIIYFRCNDGGVAKRWFFVVAAHGREDGLVLVRKLYLPLGKHSFDTREAHRLRYPDQNLSKHDRIARQIWKRRASLGFTDDLCGEYGPKPPYMRTKTFKRQCRKLDELEWRRLGSIRLRGRPPKFNRTPHRYAVSLPDMSLAGFGRIERKEMPARGIDWDPGDASADPPIPAKTTGIGISGNSTEILGIFDR